MLNQGGRQVSLTILLYTTTRERGTILVAIVSTSCAREPRARKLNCTLPQTVATFMVHMSSTTIICLNFAGGGGGGNKKMGRRRNIKKSLPPVWKQGT